MPDLSSNQIYAILNSFQNLSHAVGRIADAMEKQQAPSGNSDDNSGEAEGNLEKAIKEYRKLIYTIGENIEKTLDDEGLSLLQKHKILRDIATTIIKTYGE